MAGCISPPKQHRDLTIPWPCQPASEAPLWHPRKRQAFQNHALLQLLEDDFPTHMKEENTPKTKLGYKHMKCEAEGLWYLPDASNSINKLVCFPEEFNPVSYLGKGWGAVDST